MKQLHIFLVGVMLMFLTACETDLLKTTITDGTAPVLSSNVSQVTLLRADSANNALSFNWTSPNYLEDTSNGDVVGLYFVEIDKNESFTSAEVIATGNNKQLSYSVYKLNKLMLDMKLPSDVASDVYVRVKSVFFSEDTLVSNVLKLSVTPYTTVIPPAIAVPAELWISGGAIPAGWQTPFPADQKFTKETATTFSLTIDLLGGKDYELITDGTGANWTPCYRIDPALDPATMVNGGTFVWDGNGSAYSWGSKKFLTPANDGTYKLTFNFQDATFTVIDVSGPPAIAVPEQLWIYGDGLNGGWVTPFPAERQFTKVGKTKFSVSIFIKAGTDYELITDGTGANWTPCYRIDPALDRTTMVWGGTFVWDGNGSAYSWGSKKFLSPPEDGTYKFTFDFQTATYTVAAE
jgi:uncharacterized protein (DUF2147 family)